MAINHTSATCAQQQDNRTNQYTDPQFKFDLKQTLDKLPNYWRFTPVNGNKECYVDNWQNRPLSKEDLRPYLDSRYCKGIGLLCGEHSGGLLLIDHDGESATEKILELSGCDSIDEALPTTVGFTSGKKGRYQLVYQVPQEFWNKVKTRKFKTGTKVWNEFKQKEEGELVELRWNGCQSVIAGNHPETGAYNWLDGQAPWDVDVAIAPDWIIKLAIGETKAPKEPKNNNASQQEDFNFSDDHQETSSKSKSENNDSENDSENDEAPPKHPDSLKALKALNRLDPKRADDYDDWINVGMALHYVSSYTGEDLSYYWMRWSSLSPKFDEIECFIKWESFDEERDEKITLASLIHWANEDNRYSVPSNRSLESVVVKRVFADNWIVIDDAFYQYQDGWGYWKHVPDPKVKSFLARELEKFYQEKTDKEGNIHKLYTLGTENNKNHCFKYAQSYLTLENPPNNRHLLAFKNGTVDLRTGEIGEHKKDNYLISAIPLEYHPTDEIPSALYEFLCSSYGEEQIKLIRAVFAMFLDPTAPYGKFVHFIGESGSGKGLMIRLIKSFTDSSRSLTEFSELATPEGRHQHLTGVSIAVAPDCGGYINNLRAFYELVDNGSMSGRALYAGHGYEKQWDVRFAIASVDHLQIENAGDGWKRRCIPIPTKGAPPKPDLTLETRLLEERGSIVGWALSMPKEERNEILFNSNLWSQQSQEKVQEQDIYSDSVRAFLDLCFRPSDKATDSIDDGLMYDYYRQFCAVSGFKSFNINKFKSHLKGVIPFSRISGKKKRINGKEVRLTPTWCYIKPVDGVFTYNMGQIECNKYAQVEGGLSDIQFFAKHGELPKNSDGETAETAETVTETAKTVTAVSAKTPSHSESPVGETVETVRQGKSFADAKNIEYTFSATPQKQDNGTIYIERKLLGCRSVSAVSEEQKLLTERFSAETHNLSQDVSVTVSMTLAVSDRVTYMGRNGTVMEFDVETGYPLIHHDDGTKVIRDPSWIELLIDEF